MKNILLFFFAMAAASLASCDTKSVTDSSQGIETINVSTTYKTPKFVNDQRITRIKALAPDLQKIFEDYASVRKIPGISYGIVVDDSLVIASSTGVAQIENKIPASTKTSFRIASMSKSFTAMAIMKLRDEGKLRLSDPVTSYIPELKSLEHLTDDSPVIDIEMLLTMTAGFPEDNPWGDRQLEQSNDWFKELIAEGLSLSNVSSSHYEYSNTGYALLGRIITEVSGKRYQDYITDEILTPLGMANTFWEYSDIPTQQLAHGYRWEDEEWKPEPMLHDGSFGSIGGIFTSIEDFSKYVSFHLSAWPARSGADNGPLKRSSLREMHRPQFTSLNTWATDWNNEPCAQISGYGYGLRISTNCNDLLRVSHGGALPGFGSNYAFFPEYGIGIMAFGNLTYTRPIPYDQVEKLLFEQLDLQPRQLPVSDILAQKQGEIAGLITDGKVDLDQDIFADNFFLDRSKEKRTNEFQEILDKAGEIEKIGELTPLNQLRGYFQLHGANGNIQVFFTLSPEKNPMIQRLNVSFEAKDRG